MTEERFFSSYAKGFSIDDLNNIDIVRLSLLGKLSVSDFFVEKDGRTYVQCQALTDARACAEEFLRLTEGWTVTEADKANGFERFEGKVVKLAD